MRKIIAALLLGLGGVGVAWACTTTTIITSDRTVVCTTCCYNGNCTTTCF